jgi:hypothetical protein
MPCARATRMTWCTNNNSFGHDGPAQRPLGPQQPSLGQRWLRHHRESISLTRPEDHRFPMPDFPILLVYCTHLPEAGRYAPTTASRREHRTGADPGRVPSRASRSWRSASRGSELGYTKPIFVRARADREGTSYCARRTRRARYRAHPRRRRTRVSQRSPMNVVDLLHFREALQERHRPPHERRERVADIFATAGRRRGARAPLQGSTGRTAR